MLLLSVHVFLLWASASDYWQVWPLKLLLRFSSAHWVCGADDGAVAQRLNGGEPVAQPQHTAQPPAAVEWREYAVCSRE